MAMPRQLLPTAQYPRRALPHLDVLPHPPLLQLWRTIPSRNLLFRGVGVGVGVGVWVWVGVVGVGD